MTTGTGEHEADEPLDYPRPAAPGEGRHAPPHHDEEAPLRREKKHESDKKQQELLSRKAEANRPTRDAVGTAKGYGAGGRIAQPAGKGFGV